MKDDEDRGRPAATVVILRDMPRGPPQILLMERSSTMAFAPGALVFPGGAVDPADHALAALIDHGLDMDEAAARIAAIRETVEECGLGVGLCGAVEPDALTAVRAGLDAGQSLGTLLPAWGMTLALDQLVPFARWHPPSGNRAIRIYDTRFYLARAQVGQDASVDATENVRLLWSSAADALARSDAGEGQIIYPTRRNLERLAQFDNYADIVAHAAQYPVEKIHPWIEDRDGERHLCIPTHLGYPITSEPIGQARRG